MKLRKFLAVLLCVAAVISVMAVVAYASQAAQQAALQEEIPFPSETSTTTTTTATTTRQSIGDWWSEFYPKFNSFYQGIFNAVQKVLLFLFNLLLSIIGLR